MHLYPKKFRFLGQIQQFSWLRSIPLTKHPVAVSVHTHTIHVWYIYLHLVVFNGKEKQVNVGKYTIHGCYGIKHSNDFCYDIDYINSLAGYLSINRICDPISGTIIEGTSEKDPQNHFELRRFIGIPY